EKHKRFYTDFSQPVTMEPGADLMLLHPDGKEELLVAGGQGSITDPVVSFDGEWVYYSHLYDLQKPDQWAPSPEGADIFKIHVQHSGDAGHPGGHFVGTLDDPSRWHELAAAGKRLRPWRRTQRLSFSNAALPRRACGGGILQPEQFRFRCLYQAARIAPCG